MRVTSRAAVMLAVSGLWLATFFTVHGNVAGTNPAAPGAVMSSASFGPLRNDICEDGSGDAASRAGLDGKQMPGGAPGMACGQSRPRDWAAADD